MDMLIEPYSRSVYYYETDRMGVVHHSNYIRWMEESRIDFLKKVGIPYDDIERSGLMIPVLEASCKYKYALCYGDEFVVIPQFVDYNGFKFSISYEIYNKATKKLCATATSSHCFTDMNMKPVRLSKADPELHEKFTKSMDVRYNFER